METLDRIQERNHISIEEEMKRSYLDYAMSVIIGRALPDVRDGMKPVHRRVLWAMHELGNQYNKAYKKSARVVGDTIGKYHPHGDTAVYDTIVRLAQDFSMRYPLVDGQGNFGCFTGDTKIKLLDGTEKSFAELAHLPKDEIFYVYAVGKNGRVIIGEGRHARVTRHDAELIEVELDTGARIRCTPDHRFMLRDGSYKQAQDLTPEDSLMAGYFDTAKVNERTNKYLRVLQPSTGRYDFVHHLADAYNFERGAARRFEGAFVRHHKNFNRFDNRPTNIERMEFLEHLHLHAEQMQALWQSDDFRAAQRAGVKRYYDQNPDVREARRKKFVAQNKDLKHAAHHYNHRIVAIRRLAERADVYDITVDVHHNFLLANGVFVHNSVDGDTAAAMRYCVAGETLVVTDKGLLPIAKMSAGDENISAKVLSHGGETNTASKWWASGVHPTKRVRTKHGFEVTATDNHPLLVFRAGKDGTPGFAWKLVSQLETGDYLVIDRSEKLWTEEDVSLVEFYPSLAETSRTVRHELPRVLTEDLAFLLGALTAEGSVQADRIEFCNNAGDFADAFRHAWQRTFPTCRLHVFNRAPSGYSTQGYLQMQIVSQQVVRFLHALGLRGKSHEKLLPEIILRAPQRVIAAFLRGLFEGDGSVERSGKSLLRVSLCSNSSELLKSVQTVLLRFGIVASHTSDASHNRATSRLAINGRDNLMQFAARIGFASQVKRERLVEVITLLTGRALAKSDFIPLIAAYLPRRAVGQQHWIERNNFDRPPRLRRALPRLERALTTEDYRMIERRARMNYLFDPVASITDAGEQAVYSLRVDSLCHSFVANGFVNHNTEVRMSRLTSEILADIEKETVDFTPNYDESLSEPTVLPTRVPNLLINGADGIAVGMATKIPPHNLGEIVDATVALLRKPQIREEDLLKHVPGPDFPTGGFIYGREGIRQAQLTGRGIVQMRARAGIDRIGRGTTERDAIIITEIPFQVNKARLIERIAELVNEKKLEGISDLRDESNRIGMRIVVELKRDAVPQVVLNKLYKMTPMQSSFGVNFLAIVGGQPRVLTLKQTLEAFIEFRREVVRRRTEFELRKARARAHILEGLSKAIDALDYIIPLIRNAASVDQAKLWMTGNFAEMNQPKSWKGVPNDLTLAGFLSTLQKTIGGLQFSEAQAQAILDLQLRRLSALERQRILDEYETIIKLIAELEEILGNENSLRNVIVKELEAVKKEFDNPRRTEIVDEGVDLSIEDLIADEDVAITVTNSGYIKRTPVTAYQRQGRGGKGKFGAGTGKSNDFVEHLFVASTHSYIMIFTDDGQVFKLKVHELPDAERASRGKAVVNLINIPTERKLAGVMPVKNFVDDRFVVMVTRKGVIKKTALSDFKNINARGINAINIDEGDELLDVMITDGTKQILIATHDGQAIRFKEEDARAMGRAARGTRGVTLREGDYVVAVCAISPEASERMLSVSEEGYGKQTKVSDYRLQSRGGRGVINMKTTAKTGKVVAVFSVEDDSEIMIITQQGKLIRIESAYIRKTGRSASGVRLIKTDGTDRVTSASIVDPETEAEAISAAVEA